MTVRIFAPNVHHGGGFVLLAALAKDWPEGTSCTAFLDLRAADRLQVPADWNVHWVTKSFRGRLLAEWQLADGSAGARLVFCFHNLPPVFRCRAPVVCYVQNPMLVGLSKPSNFSGWVRARLVMERFIARVFRHNVDEYVVQTPTMEAALRRWLGPNGRGQEPSIRRMPFVDPHALPKPAVEHASFEWDFLYVSDGQAHKNHRRLFDAWVLLSQQGLNPSLAVTLHPVYDRVLEEHLAQLQTRHRLNIVNLGHMPHTEFLNCYKRAGAMLFASYAESYGIPFLEARAAKLPILAAELDFVRDMCQPIETFDPFSAVSIARAVKRYLGEPDPPLQPLAPAAFIEGLLSLQRAASGEDARAERSAGRRASAQGTAR